MKKIFLLLITVVIFLAYSQSSFAQKDSSGIYYTEQDFIDKKLSFAINVKTEKHKINDTYFLNESDIRIKHHDSVYTVKKSEIWGYKSTSGMTIRFYDNNTYEVLNPNEQVLLYKHVHITPEVKSAPTVFILYFFTRYAQNVPVELTKANVKAAFGDNPKFCAAIDENFKSDGQLIAFDKDNHLYKLNWLLQMSSK